MSGIPYYPLLAFIGTTEIIIICVVIVLLFGASAIPKFARNIGKAKKEFQKGMQEGAEEDDDEDASEDKQPASKERKL